MRQNTSRPLDPTWLIIKVVFIIKNLAQKDVLAWFRERVQLMLFSWIFDMIVYILYISNRNAAHSNIWIWKLNSKLLQKWLYVEFFNLHSSSQTMVKIPVRDPLLSVASGNVYSSLFIVVELVYSILLTKSKCHWWFNLIVVY